MDLTECAALEDISVLESCLELSILDCTNCPQLNDFDFLANHPKLQAFTSTEGSLNSLAFLSTIPTLRKIILNSVSSGINLSELGKGENLEEVIIISEAQHGHEIISNWGHFKKLGIVSLKDIFIAAKL